MVGKKESPLLEKESPRTLPDQVNVKHGLSVLCAFFVWLRH